MKKNLVGIIVLIIVSSLLFAQNSAAIRAENTVQLEFGVDAEKGSGFEMYHLREQFDMFYNSERFDFVGRIRVQIGTDFDNYFAFGSQNDDFWDYTKDLKATAFIRPVTGLELGLGTDIEWKAGTRSFWDDSETRYAVTYDKKKSAGAWDAYRADLYADNGFGARFTIGGFNIGASIPFQYVDDPKDFLINFGASLNLSKFSIGAAWKGDFNSSSNAKNPWSIYAGASINLLEAVGLDVFFNHLNYRSFTAVLATAYADSETNVGARVNLDFKILTIKPEFAIAFYEKKDTEKDTEKDNVRNTFFIGVPVEIKLSESFAINVCGTFATGSKAKNAEKEKVVDSKFCIAPGIVIDTKKGAFEVSVPIDFQTLASRNQGTYLGFASRIRWVAKF